MILHSRFVTSCSWHWGSGSFCTRLALIVFKNLHLWLPSVLDYTLAYLSKHVVLVLCQPNVSFNHFLLPLNTLPRFKCTSGLYGNAAWYNTHKVGWPCLSRSRLAPLGDVLVGGEFDSFWRWCKGHWSRGFVPTHYSPEWALVLWQGFCQDCHFRERPRCFDNSVVIDWRVAGGLILFQAVKICG